MSEQPKFGKWYAYEDAPAGSYACLVSQRAIGSWSTPVMQWMPATGRGTLSRNCAVMPFLLASDPLAWKE
jgi:hypothetical protein